MHPAKSFQRGSKTMGRGLESCSDCRFWNGGNREQGNCRVNPPVIYNTATSDQRDDDLPEFWGRWPLTFEEWWCGKYEPAN